MGWPVQVVGTTGSTNSDLAACARAGERGPLVLAARAQTAGRGRLGRSWQSPAGASLSVSVLWAPPAPQAAWTWVPMVVGLGVLDGLHELGVGAGLKWPNDVVVAAGGRHGAATGAPDAADAHPYAVTDVGPGTTRAPATGALTGLAKLAGILVDVVTGPAGPVVVAGVGVNLRPPGPLSGTAAAPPAASLSELLPPGAPSTDEHGTFERALAAVAAGLERRLTAWGDDPAGPTTRDDYVAACTTLGRRVRVSTPAGPRDGRAVEVDRTGALVLDTDDGRVAVSAGDVEHVR